MALAIPLPCIVYVKDADNKGIKMFSSGKFKSDSHGTGSVVDNRFLLYHHKLMYVSDASFPMGKIEPECYGHHYVEEDGKKKEKETSGSTTLVESLACTSALFNTHVTCRGSH